MAEHANIPLGTWLCAPPVALFSLRELMQTLISNTHHKFGQIVLLCLIQRVKIISKTYVSLLCSQAWITPGALRQLPTGFHPWNIKLGFILMLVYLYTWSRGEKWVQFQLMLCYLYIANGFVSWQQDWWHYY